MNTCKKCGLAFYGATGENYCGDCRKAAGKALPQGQASAPRATQKVGFWRRLFGSRRQG